MKNILPTLAERVAILRRTPLFTALNARALDVLAHVSHSERAPKGRALFRQGDDAAAAYIVCTGRIAIMLNAADRRELVIDEMRAGDCFGELALLTAQTRSANAIAQEDSELLVIPRAAFLAELANEPKLLRQLLELTARRLSSSSERESALAFLDAPERLARALLQLDRQSGEQGYIILSQAELAQRIGVARQTVAKTLGQWRRAGWILTGRGRIIVLNRSALRKLLEA